MKQNTKSIAVFGDSISKGVIFDTVTQKYRVLKNNSTAVFNKLSGIAVKNYSRFGCTVTKSVNSLKMCIKKEERPDYALIELGGNDCDYDWKEVSDDPTANHHAKTPITVFKKTMADMVDALRENHINPVLMSLPPIDAELYFNWIGNFYCVDGERVMMWLKEKSMLYRNQEFYSRSIEKLAIKMSVPLINIREKFLLKNDLRKYLCIDGIHLNEEGHELLGKEYYKFAVEHGFSSA